MIRPIIVGTINALFVGLAGLIGLVLGGLVDAADAHLLDALLPFLSVLLLGSTLVWAVRDAHPIRRRQ